MRSRGEPAPKPTQGNRKTADTKGVGSKSGLRQRFQAAKGPSLATTKGGKLRKGPRSAPSSASFHPRINIFERKASPATKKTSGPDVSLGTAEAVLDILRTAEEPLTRAAILAAMKERGRSTTRQRLNRAISFFDRLDLVAEGSKGLQFTHNPNQGLQDALRAGRSI